MLGAHEISPGSTLADLPPKYLTLVATSPRRPHHSRVLHHACVRIMLPNPL